MERRRRQREEQQLTWEVPQHLKRLKKARTKSSDWKAIEEKICVKITQKNRMGNEKMIWTKKRRNVQSYRWKKRETKWTRKEKRWPKWQKTVATQDQNNREPKRMKIIVLKLRTKHLIANVRHRDWHFFHSKMIKPMWFSFSFFRFSSRLFVFLSLQSISILFISFSSSSTLDIHARQNTSEYGKSVACPSKNENNKNQCRHKWRRLRWGPSEKDVLVLPLDCNLMPRQLDCRRVSWLLSREFDRNCFLLLFSFSNRWCSFEWVVSKSILICFRRHT